MSANTSLLNDRFQGIVDSYRYVVSRRPLTTLATLLLALLTPSAFAAIVYVDIDNTLGSQNGTTWSTAYTSIQTAIDAANAGDEIWVAQGVYVGSVDVKADLALYGGFTGIELQREDRDFVRNPTQIRPSVSPGLFVELDSNVRLDGFGVSGWRMGFAGAIHVQRGTTSAQFEKVTIANCVVEDNLVTGINILNVDADIQNCIIRNIYMEEDYAPVESVHNAAVQLGNGRVTIRDCEISDNEGNGILCGSGMLDIIDSTIQRNARDGILMRGEVNMDGCRVQSNLHDGIEINLSALNPKAQRIVNTVIQHNVELGIDALIDRNIDMSSRRILFDVSNSLITDNGYSGVEFFTSTDASLANIVSIRNSVIMDNKVYGIYSPAQNPELFHCLFDGNQEGEVWSRGAGPSNSASAINGLASAQSNRIARPNFASHVLGQWLSPPTYDPGKHTTTFRDSTVELVPDSLVGYTLYARKDQEESYVIGRNTASTITVLGNARAHFRSPFDYYRVTQFHLAPDSPGIDEGTTLDASATDFEGDPRPLGSGIDIGIDEWGYADTDGDGQPDAVDLDDDNDGISDLDELYLYFTDPLLSDTDFDGLSDFEELFLHGTQPSAFDSDDDGFGDSFEISAGTDPGNAQSRLNRLYVTLDGAGLGQDWARGLSSIQMAIEIASRAKVPIWVKEGHYNEALTFESDTMIYGGFSGTETSLGQRNVKAFETRVDASGYFSRVVTMEGVVNCVLDGVTLTGSKSINVVNAHRYGYDELMPPHDFGGIYIGDSDDSIVIANCRITGNANTNGRIARDPVQGPISIWARFHYAGDAVMIENASPTIRHSQIEDNGDEFWSLDNNTLNHSVGSVTISGGQSNPLIDGCRIANNRYALNFAPHGIFSYRSGPNVRVVNCTIVDQPGAGIYSTNHISIVDCDILGSGRRYGTAPPGFGFGIKVQDNPDDGGVSGETVISGVTIANSALTGLVIDLRQDVNSQKTGTHRVVISDCSILAGSGGGLDLSAYELIIDNTLIAGNRAIENFARPPSTIKLSGFKIEFNNCVISGNYSSGAVITSEYWAAPTATSWVPHINVTFRNSIISGNVGFDRDAVMKVDYMPYKYKGGARSVSFVNCVVTDNAVFDDNELETRAFDLNQCNSVNFVNSIVSNPVDIEIVGPPALEEAALEHNIFTGVNRKIYKQVDGISFDGSRIHLLPRAKNNLLLNPAFVDPNAGEWTGAQTFDATTGVTTLTVVNAPYEPNELVGKFLKPIPTRDFQVYIVSNTETTISVAGKFAQMTLPVQGGDTYHIIDYHLSDHSPAINAGTSQGAPDYDIVGNIRPMGAAVDIGAYEWNGGGDNDGDGIGNYYEVNWYGTDPNNADTDGDGLSDWDEIFSFATDPLSGDSDGDGLNDFDEVEIHFTNPMNSDSDGDGFGDFAELNIFGTDPNNALDYPKAVYVKPSASGAGNGSSWAHATGSIQAAIDSVGAGVAIWVARGVYRESVDLKSGVEIYGGFAGGELLLEHRRPSENPTIIDASGLNTSAVLMYGTTNAVLDGFTITGGNNFHGGGVYVRNANASNRIVNCVITGNTATYHGGGLSMIDSAPFVINCVIANNHAGQNGGAIYLNEGHPVLANCTLSGNTSGSIGGGLFVHASRPVLTNSILHGHAKHAIYEYDSASDATLVRCLFNANTGGDYFDYGSGSLSGTGALNALSSVSGTLSGAPSFVDAPNGDFHIRANSAAKNTGTSIGAFVPGEDVDGDARPFGGVIDVGADEWSDLDGDGVRDYLDADDDGDGLSDLDEINLYGTDPRNADSDGDGVSDGQEIAAGADPNDDTIVPTEVWVDFAWNGNELGTASAPCKNITTALNVLRDGGAIHINGSSSTKTSTWTGRITTPITMQSNGGTITIGN